MERPEDWTSDSNEVVKLHFEGTLIDNVNLTIQPKFTYPIFGEEEKIFGFQGLLIDITFASDTLLPLLEIRWKARLESHLGVEIDDPDVLLSEYLSAEVFRDRPLWEQAKKEKSQTFRPPGQCIHSYTATGRSYKVYKASLVDSIAATHLERLQIFSILYIEAASPIDATDERFDVYMTYVEDHDGYQFIGYCTCYKFFFYDKLQHTFDVIRYRISQFLILPCYQSQGHGAHLYDAIIDDCLANEKILEITVEDPSEAFDDLRDRRDLLRICGDSDISGRSELFLLSKEALDRLRRKLKIAPRQFARLIEMICLRTDDLTDPKNLKLYAQFVKRRLYKKNKDVLKALDSAEARSVLEKTYQALIEDYTRLLDGLRGGIFSIKTAQQSKRKTLHEASLNTAECMTKCQRLKA